MRLDPEIQFIKLRLVNAAGRLCKKALSLLSFRKCDNVPDIVRSGQEHYESVQAECDTAVRRRSEFQRLQEKAEPVLRLLPCDFQQVENFGLYFGLMNTNTSAADFRTVHNYIISLRPDIPRVCIKFTDIFRHRSRKWMMQRIISLILLVPFK